MVKHRRLNSAYGDAHGKSSLRDKPRPVSATQATTNTRELPANCRDTPPSFDRDTGDAKERGG